MTTRIIRLLVLSGLALLLGPADIARATTFGSAKFKCPLCGTTFESTVVGSTSSSGSTDEGRPISIGFDTQRTRIHTCTKCRYTAFSSGFVRGWDEPDGRRAAALRAALAKETKGLQAGALAWPKRVDLCVATYRARKPLPFGLVRACMLGAWLADDDKAKDLAAAYRRRTVEAARAFLADPGDDDPYYRTYARYLAGVICAKTGRLAEAVKFFDEMGAALEKDLAELDKQEKQLEKKLSQWDKASQAERDKNADEISRLNERLYGISGSRDGMSGMSGAAIGPHMQAKQKLLGEDKAREVYRTKGRFEKEAFLEVYGQSSNARTLAIVVAALKEADTLVRLGAAKALARRPALPAEAIEPLIGAMSDRVDDVREAAIEALTASGAASPKVVAALLKATNHPLDNVRAASVKALGRLALKDSHVTRAVIVCLKDKVHAVRAGAAEALGGMGPDAPGAIDALVAMLKGNKYDLKPVCVSSLAKIGPAAIPALRKALRQEDGSMRAHAAQALGAMGPAAIEADDDLLAALVDTSEDEYGRRVAAVQALEKLGVTHERFIAALGGAICSDDGELRKAAGWVAVFLGPAAEGAQNAIAAAVRSPRTEGKAQAVDALIAVGADTKLALSVLIPLLDDQKGWGLYEVHGAIGKLGPAAKPAARHLIKQLRLKYRTVRWRAARTLGQIGPVVADQAVGPLMATLADSDGLTRRYAATALGQMGPAAGEAVDELIKMLIDHDEYVRADVARALGRIGPKASAAAGPLARLLADKSGDVSAAAAEALGSIGPLNDKALAALAAVAASPGSPIRLSAAGGLVGAGRRDEGIDVMLAVLTNRKETPRLRDDAVLRLMALKARDTRVVTALKAVAREKDDTAVPAAVALVKLGHPDDALGALEWHMRTVPPDDWLWRDVLESVEKLGAKADPLAPLLAEALARCGYEKRDRQIVDALVKLGPAGARAVKPLQTHKEWRRRHFAAEVIRRVKAGK